MTFAVPTAVTAGTADVDATTEPTLLYGYSFHETAGATADITIRDGTGDNTGTIVAVIELAANTSETVAFATPVRCNGGVRIERGTGTTEGAIWVEND